MRQLSDADFDLIIRLLRHLSAVKWDSRKDKERARKAGLLARKMERRKNDGGDYS